MKRRLNLFLFLSGVLALLAGGGMFRYAYSAYDAIVATRPVVVAAVDIPPYTILTESHLTVRDLPRALETEPIFLSLEEAVGRITVGPIPAGAVLYRALAVPPASFRFVADPTLEVVSIPVDPARAVGGQVRVGQRVNVYRVALARAAGQERNPLDVLARRGAEAQLLVSGAPVVDVRSGSGEPVSAAPPPSEVERSAMTSGGTRPLQIITLAVPPAVAQDLIRLAVEQDTGEYKLWITLAPVP